MRKSHRKEPASGGLVRPLYLSAQNQKREQRYDSRAVREFPNIVWLIALAITVLGVFTLMKIEVQLAAIRNLLAELGQRLSPPNDEV